MAAFFSRTACQLVNMRAREPQSDWRHPSPKVRSAWPGKGDRDISRRATRRFGGFRRGTDGWLTSDMHVSIGQFPYRPLVPLPRRILPGLPPRMSPTPFQLPRPTARRDSCGTATATRLYIIAQGWPTQEGLPWESNSSFPAVELSGFHQPALPPRPQPTRDLCCVSCSAQGSVATAPGFALARVLSDAVVSIKTCM